MIFIFTSFQRPVEPELAPLKIKSTFDKSHGGAVQPWQWKSTPPRGRFLKCRQFLASQLLNGANSGSIDGLFRPQHSLLSDNAGGELSQYYYLLLFWLRLRNTESETNPNNNLMMR